MRGDAAEELWADYYIDNNNNNGDNYNSISPPPLTGVGRRGGSALGRSLRADDLALRFLFYRVYYRFGEKSRNGALDPK